MKYNITRNIEPHIFRGYDVRGIYGEDLTEDVAYTFGLAFGTYVKEHKAKFKEESSKCKVIVGRDNRSSSDSLRDALVEGITDSGVDVIDIGLSTTPMYYFSWGYLGIFSDIMITASHNPKEYNGFKFALDKSGNACGKTIKDFREYILNATLDIVSEDKKGNIEYTSVKDEYVKFMLNNIHLNGKKLKVVIDPGNGSSCFFVKEIFNAISKIEPIYICDTSDSSFPNHHPDPSEEKNMQMLKDKVLEVGASIGLSFDGDADRIGVVDSFGRFVSLDKYMCIMAKKLLEQDKENKILSDVRCTKALEETVKSMGGEYERYRSGNSYIKARVLQGDFALGGELSGHVFFNDKWPGFDDGIYAGLRLLEVLSNGEKTLEELVDEVKEYVSSPALRLDSTENTKYIEIDKMKEYVDKKGYEMSTIDGVRASGDTWWMLFRASETSPKVELRIEADTKEEYDKRYTEFTEVIKENKERILEENKI